MTKRDIEKETLGLDPAIEFGKNFDPTMSNIVRALNWYSYYYQLEDAKKWTEKYLGFEIPEKTVPMWVGVYARLLSHECPMPDDTDAKIRDYAKGAIAREELRKSSLETSKAHAEAVFKMNPVIAHLDMILDGFYRSNYRLEAAPNIYDVLKEAAFKQADARAAVLYYQPLLEEVQARPKEGYDHLNKTQLNTYINFLQRIVEDLRTFATNERKVNKVRKPRKKKAKSADQLTSKVQFLKEHQPLKLVSITPAKIIGAQAVWLFNVRYSRLTYLSSNKKEGLSVKGTTVIDFAPELSKTKTIRKPEKNLPWLLDMGKVTMLKEFGKLKTKDIEANGRIGKDTIILRIG